MVEQTGHEPKRRSAVVRALLEVGLPAFAFFVGLGFATRNWSASLITGLAVSSMIYAISWFDRRFLHPHLAKLPQDWARLGLEMTLT